MEAKRRIRDALGLWIDDAGVEVDFDVIFRVKRSRRSRPAEQLARAPSPSGHARHATRKRAAVELVERVGLGVRDAADLLGLSHQRVHRILDTSRSGS